ncbi:MAG: cyclic nucleotide-binding domain-containing protein [Candidatus Omnitrophota bacterium]
MENWTETNSFSFIPSEKPSKKGIEFFLNNYGLDPQGIEEVTKNLTFHRYQPGEVVFHEGDVPDTFYFIKSGQALVTRKTRGGDEQILNLLKEGSCFGEIGIIEHIGRTATVKAIGLLELFQISRDQFLEILKCSPSFSSLIREIGIRRLLNQVEIFKDLDDQSFKYIMGILVEKAYPADSIIFNENDPADSLYMIIKGGVRVCRKSESGKEINLAYFGSDDFFGEQGLIDSLPRSATAVTTEETRFLVIAKDQFQKLLQKNAMISFNMLKVLSRRMRHTSHEMSAARSVSFFEGMTIIARPERCVSCKTCEIACAVAKSRTHQLYSAIYEEPLPVKRIRVRRDQSGSEPIIRPEHCTHCKDAPCLQACKKRAIRRDVGSGTINIINDECIGCGLCMLACPFNVISLIRTEGKKRVALKCTYCMEHRAGPACVRSCPTNALVVGLAPRARLGEDYL